MKRRQVISSIGGAILGGSSTVSSNNPSVGLDFGMVSSIEPTKVDSIHIQFDGFLLTPSYVDEELNPASISVQITLDNNRTNSQSADIPIYNGETTDVTEVFSLGNMKVPVDTNQSFLKGDIKISASIGNFEEQYQQSFIVRDRIPDTTGGDKTTINPDDRGQYRLHAFESGGRFEVKSDKMLDVDLLVVGGGAGNRGGGGGGGGNYSDDTEVSGGDGGSGIVLIRVGPF